MSFHGHLCEVSMESVEFCIMVIIKPQAPVTMTATINFSLGSWCCVGGLIHDGDSVGAAQLRQAELASVWPIGTIGSLVLV